MNGIQLMIEEHVYIKRVLKVVRKMCLLVYKHKPIDFDDFEIVIDFVREYADKHHHGKEEELLFNRIIDETGEIGEKLITHGMMVEHFQGRFFIHELESALIELKKGKQEVIIDVIANAISYVNLLERHIDKEDKVVYTFAERKLKAETIEQINAECDIFEQKQAALSIQAKYKKVVQDLELKYR
jgi:hemerythrin-like domain-containing protein